MVELVDLVETYGGKAHAEDGYEYNWMRIEDAVAKLRFADPAPTPEMIKKRATEADKELCHGQEVIGWCYAHGWPEINLEPNDAVVFVCADIEWTHIDRWS
jgi:hypothetical protein